jgi:hypothetical protein
MSLSLSNDSNLSCPSNMAAPQSEVQAELCGPTGLPKGQLQILVRTLLASIRPFEPWMSAA